MLSVQRRHFIAIALAATFASPAFAQVTLDTVKQNGKITVATEALYEPFEFVENGKIAGYGKDILDDITKSWGVELEQMDLPFAGILVGLQQKKYDLVATTLIINPERAKKYAFTSPIAAAPVTLMKRKGNEKVKTLDDLSGLVVGGVVPPAGPTVFMQNYNKELTTKGKGASKFVMFQGQPDMFLALANGQVDVAVENMISLGRLAKKEPDKFEIVGTLGTPFYIGWVTRPEDSGLRDAINVELHRLRESGKLTELQKKWFGYTMDTPESGYLPEDAK